MIDKETMTHDLKSEMKLPQEILEQLTRKESMIDKETMTNPVEINKSSDVKIQTLDNRTNINPIEILSTNKST
jgi:hypothetical protein